MTNNENLDSLDLKGQIYRYIVFWPIFLISVISFVCLGYIYIRYTPYIYESTAKIKVLDQERDLALPTAMTIFNRSMINLENEIELLKSSTLIGSVVENLNLQIKFYNLNYNKIHETLNKDWMNGENHIFNIDKDFLKNTKDALSFRIDVTEKGFVVFDEILDKEFKTSSYEIDSKDIPFYLKIEKNNVKNILDKSFRIQIMPFVNAVSAYRESIDVRSVGQDSDILTLTLKGSNVSKNTKILNTLINYFNQDGINDRRLNSKRTIDFVDNRIIDLDLDLEDVEGEIRDFKISKQIIEVSETAKFSLSQKLNYETELLKVSTQLSLTELLYESIIDKEDELLPINIGLDDSSINNLTISYNELIFSKNKASFGAGKNNPVINIYNDNIDKIRKNIISSLDSYKNQLTLNKEILEAKNSQYLDRVLELPEEEKVLRSIKREQSIKEAIFLLLLQKREEASINFAVTSPSIKVIDYTTSSIEPISPDKKFIYLFNFSLGIALPFLILTLWFNLDTKIHLKSQLTKRVSVPVIGEIPYVKDQSLLKKFEVSKNSRDIISESIRMVIANLNFVLFKNNKTKCNTLLVTSSIKGEGKTLISTCLASNLSNSNNKVLLIGADLRNPQIHKFLDLSKDEKLGLSDYIFKDNADINDFIFKVNDTDILLSGTIPPNPTELLGSDKMNELISKLKEKYDYIVIDSAPSVLVADTFKLSNYSDATIYVVRSSFSDANLTDFINDCHSEKRLKNINLVLNAVGSGLAYGYRYGYGYNYKYGYNYGYGYGYTSD